MIDSVYVDNYFKDHLMKKISIGNSGVHVYSVDEDKILKYITNKADDNEWKLSLKESMIYNYFNKNNIKFVPDIITNFKSNNEIFILMKKYNEFVNNEIDNHYIDKVACLLAYFHNLDIPCFLENKEEKEMTKSQIEYCYNRWRNIIEEHNNSFSLDNINKLATNINRFIKYFNDSKKCFIHGDFHIKNILVSDKKSLILCDWQNSHIGNPSYDLALFVSRLNADNIKFNEELLIKRYVFYNNKLGNKIKEEDITRYIAFSNLKISFTIWYYYLCNNTADRVHKIYDRMINDMEKLLEVC